MPKRMHHAEEEHFTLTTADLNLLMRENVTRKQCYSRNITRLVVVSLYGTFNLEAWTDQLDDNNEQYCSGKTSSLPLRFGMKVYTKNYNKTKTS